jgi:hypothetical protein
MEGNNIWRAISASSHVKSLESKERQSNGSETAGTCVRTVLLRTCLESKKRDVEKKKKQNKKEHAHTGSARRRLRASLVGVRAARSRQTDVAFLTRSPSTTRPTHEAIHLETNSNTSTNTIGAAGLHRRRCCDASHWMSGTLTKNPGSRQFPRPRPMTTLRATKVRIIPMSDSPLIPFRESFIITEACSRRCSNAAVEPWGHKNTLVSVHLEGC